MFVQVRSDLYGITILQFFFSTGYHHCLWFLKQRLSGSVISIYRHLRGLSGDHHWIITPLAVNANSVLSTRAGKAPVCLDIISKILSLSSIYSSSNIGKSACVIRHKRSELQTRSHTKKIRFCSRCSYITSLCLLKRHSLCFYV